jgi:high-affinity iron transporter
MIVARVLLLVFFALSLSARAADNTAQTVVHMLDYVSVDYPSFVKDGKVVDETEYKEQREFSAQIVELLRKLPDTSQHAQLVKEAQTLQARIDAKAAGSEVSRLASELRWRVIGAYKVTVAPKSAPDLKRGAALYAEQCAGCHGVDGRGDGPAAKGLDPQPANFHDGNRMAQRSVYGLYSTITLGVAGTSMAPYGQLSEGDRWALAFHVGALDVDRERAARGEALWQLGRGRTEIGNLRAVSTLDERDVTARYGPEIGSVFAWLKTHPSALHGGGESPIAYSRRLLSESAAAYEAGKQEEAQRLALTSYLEGFELAEASLDAVDPNLRQEVENQMIVYRDLMRRGAPAREVMERARHIDALLVATADKLDAEGLSPTTAAVSAFFILVREGLEALLVVAAILALLKKAGRTEALPWIHAGWIGALALGFLTWFAAAKLIQVSGATRELTEGATALLAAAILLYVGFWLHDKSHAQGWRTFLEQHLRQALQRGTLWALAGVSFLAVYREAFETVLFYQALWQQAGEGAQGSIIVGLAGAIATLAIAAWIIVRSGARLPIGVFFSVCAALMAVLAVVFAGHGVKGLQEADLIAASPVGAVAVPLVGFYPTLQTILAQLVVVALVVAMYVRPRHASASGTRSDVIAEHHDHPDDSVLKTGEKL